MRRIFYALIAGAVVVAVGWWLAALPGHLSASLAGYTLETSAPVAILALVAVVLAVHGLLRLFGGVIHLPGRVSWWRARRRREGGDVAVGRALVALAAGEAGPSRREAERARRLLGDTPQTLLLAAEARRLAHQDAAAAEIYTAMSAREDTAFLGLRGLFRQAIAREDWEAAARLAERADAAHPGGTWLRGERYQVAVRLGRWRQALALAGPGAPVADLTAAAAEAEANPDAALKLAKRAFKANPDLAPAALAYARRLRAAGRERKAQSVIAQAWRAAPHPELAAFALEPLSGLARLHAAERLTGQSPGHPESAFLLARECLALGQTAAARRHLEAAREAGMAERRLWLLQADLEAEEKGDTDAGRLAQRDALRHAAEAGADPVWHCEACGAVVPKWVPACPACHAAGRIRWGGPAHPVLAAPEAETPA